VAAESSRPDLDWQEDAACRGVNPELFFAPDIESLQARLDREAEAKKVCWTCPVRIPCLTFRLGSEQQMDAGIWGAKDELERRRLRRNMIRAQKRRAA
jgi:WhiB family redox-sensing transcriptional regulator